MNHRIINIDDIPVIGMRAQVTFETMYAEMGKLARQFMPRRHEVPLRVGTHLFSIQDYKNLDYKNITPETVFDKWVAVEVSHLETIPEEMESLILKGGAYLVIDYKGTIADFPKLWDFVLNTWLPTSGYAIDSRPHFEKLPESYSPKNVENEEEVWIPITAFKG